MGPVVCLGELLIDFVPLGAGDLRTADTFQKAAGGAPANVAVGLARLGVPSAFMGQVGDDPFGRFLAGTLEAAGVDTGPLRFSKAAHTGLAFVSLAADGDRSFLFYRNPSADMLFGPDDVDAAAIARAAGLHFGSISLIAEPSRAATLHAVGLAHSAGLVVSYDPNLRPALWPGMEAARTGLLAGLEHAAIIKISEEEARFLGGRENLVECVRALWRGRTHLVTVTLGQAGCLWVTTDADGHVPGFSVAAVDTTGAGDAFTAGLLAGLRAYPAWAQEPGQLTEICRFANAMGAMTASARGAIPALPDLATVEAFLAERRGS